MEDPAPLVEYDEARVSAALARLSSMVSDPHVPEWGSAGTPGVWSSQFVAEDVCRELTGLIRELKASDPAVAPQLRPERGLPLLDLCGGLLNSLVHKFDTSLLQARKPGYHVQLAAGFAVEYGDASAQHQPHADDSHLTLNICIGDEFEGGELLVATDPLVCQHVYARVPASVVS